MKSGTGRIRSTASSIGILILGSFLMALLHGCTLVNPALNPSVVRYALVYGVADYPGTINDLQVTDDDAIAIDAVLSHYGYDSTLRLDTEVTRQRIFEDISAIGAEMTSSDILVIFFAGHGDGPYRISPDAPDLIDPQIPAPEAFEGESSLIPYYASPLEAADVIYASELHTAVGALAGSTIILLDICNSGGFVQDSWPDVDEYPQDYGQTPHPSPLLESWVHFFSPEPDIPSDRTWVIASSGANELAYEDRYVLNHGYFTYHLLAAVGYDEQEETFSDVPPADLDLDGVVSITELYGKTRSLFIEGYINAPNTAEHAKYLPHITGGPLDIAILWRD